MTNIRETSQQDRRVYVGNLSYDVKWHHLKDFMRQGASSECGGKDWRMADAGSSWRGSLRRCVTTSEWNVEGGRLHVVYGWFPLWPSSLVFDGIVGLTGWDAVHGDCRDAGMLRSHPQVLASPSGHILLTWSNRIVEYATREQAQTAVATLSNQSLMGRLVYVREVSKMLRKQPKTKPNTSFRTVKLNLDSLARLAQAAADLEAA